MPHQPHPSSHTPHPPSFINPIPPRPRQLARFPGLKTADDYVSGKFFGKQALKDSMLSWNKDVIPNAITRVHAGMEKSAMNAFRDIQVNARVLFVCVCFVCVFFVLMFFAAGRCRFGFLTQKCREKMGFIFL